MAFCAPTPDSPYLRNCCWLPAGFEKTDPCDTVPQEGRSGASAPWFGHLDRSAGRVCIGLYALWVCRPVLEDSWRGKSTNHAGPQEKKRACYKGRFGSLAHPSTRHGYTWYSGAYVRVGEDSASMYGEQQIEVHDKKLVRLNAMLTLTP